MCNYCAVRPIDVGGPQLIGPQPNGGLALELEGEPMRVETIVTNVGFRRQFRQRVVVVEISFPIQANYLHHTFLSRSHANGSVPPLVSHSSSPRTRSCKRSVSMMSSKRSVASRVRISRRAVS